MRGHGSIRLCVALAAIVSANACAISWPPWSPPPTFTQEKLRVALLEFASRYSAVVSTAADQIAEQTDSRSVRRRTLVWKVRMVPLIGEAALKDDPLEGFVWLATLVVAMNHYFTEGDGRAIFGDDQAIAIDAARNLQAELLRIGRLFLDPAQVAVMTEDVITMAREHPIRGKDFHVQEIQVVLTEVDRLDLFQWVLNLPIPVLKDVSSGAAAISKFNRTAQQFSRIVANLPRQVRWQSELLFYDVEERDTVKASLMAFAAVAENAERVSAAVDRFPEDLRQVMADSRETLDQANQAILSAHELAELAAETSEQIRLTSEIWGAVLGREDDKEPAGRLSLLKTPSGDRERGGWGRTEPVWTPSSVAIQR